MNEISQVNGVYPLPPVAAPGRTAAEAPVKSGGGTSNDQVEISDLGSLLARVRELPDVRVEKVARLRAEITAGTFETPERLAGTAERLLEELGG